MLPFWGYIEEDAEPAPIDCMARGVVPVRVKPTGDMTDDFLAKMARKAEGLGGSAIQVASNVVLVRLRQPVPVDVGVGVGVGCGCSR